MYILGISCYYHDSAAAIVCNGEIIAAVQEERFTRKKHTASLPIYSISYCLDVLGLSLSDVDAVVYYENPVLKFDRNFFTETAVRYTKKTNQQNSLTINLLQKLALPKQLREIFGKIGKQDKLFTVPHHLSHAASAFYPSPFDDAAVLVIDGVGEWSSTSLGVGQGKNLEIINTIEFPNSLGLLYSAFTYYCGFKVNSGEYKLMGLAPYGKPKYKNKILNQLIDLKDDGSFKLNLQYFGFLDSMYLVNEEFCTLFGAEPRKPESNITQREMDLAASIQDVIEEILLRIVKTLRRLTNKKNLVMAGGVALNCTANGKIIREKIFDNVWIQPASGDAGGALGAALAYYYQFTNEPIRKLSKPDLQSGSFLGPEYAQDEIVSYLKSIDAVFKEYDDIELVRAVSKCLQDGKVIGCFTGRMEFGPRALGARSIIADPRDPKIQSQMNIKIKYRESFRPFAPAVLEEYASEYFEMDGISPYMLVTNQVREKFLKKSNDKHTETNLIKRVNEERSVIPAVTHVDNSARVQTVNKDVNPRFYNIINAFFEDTGCPMVINTSFNIRGEPMVCTPEDAYRCFMGTDMDILVLENAVLIKNQQPYFDLIDNNYKDSYELD